MTLIGLSLFICSQQYFALTWFVKLVIDVFLCCIENEDTLLAYRTVTYY